MQRTLARYSLKQIYIYDILTGETYLVGGRPLQQLGPIMGEIRAAQPASYETILTFFAQTSHFVYHFLYLNHNEGVH
jgi:hypothetical protein